MITNVEIQGYITLVAKISLKNKCPECNARG